MSSSKIEDECFVTMWFYLFSLFILWIAAWVFHGELSRAFPLYFASGSYGENFYWWVMKALLWLLPIFLILKKEKRSLLDLFKSERSFKLSLFWGLASAVVWIALAGVLDKLMGKIFEAPIHALSLVGGVLVAPIVEEIAFRGFVLARLEGSFSKLSANLLTSLFFVLIHWVGWYFQGKLSLASLWDPSLLIFAFSLYAGLIKKKSTS
ncbi:MAG: CPBP family intramembrane metalloprotease, partial [Deltaproteobacteria bacterium]|nr:CPBP family intramembrane metalloprotease [Deltaproteobacteria bacterium]